MNSEDMQVTESGGNIFADLGIENPKEYQLKSRLASLLYDSIKAKGWTQKRTAEVLGITQPDVSNICRGLLDHFSAEKLLHLLARLEHRVTITVQDVNSELPAREIVIDAGSVSAEGVQAQ